MDDESTPVKDLYQRFRDGLGEPISERYYAEDELGLIFDYAANNDDDYVQLEVLLCGARLYPDSVLLAEKRLVYYLNTTDEDAGTRTEAAADFLVDHSDTDTPVFEMARLELEPPDNAVEALDGLLERINQMSVDESQRFVDLAVDMGQFDWLMEHYEQIIDKAVVPEAVQYAIAVRADQLRRNNDMLRMADALIEGDAFSPTFWIMLLRAQARLGLEDEARATFDSARALAADDPSETLRLAEVVYNDAPYLMRDIFGSVEELSNRYPDKFIYVDFMCACMVQADNVGAAVQLLHKFLDANPDNESALRQLLMFNDSMAYEYVARFKEANKSHNITEEGFFEFINSLSTRGAHRSVDAMMSNYCNDVKMQEPGISSWVEALYVLEKYERIEALSSTYPEAFDNALNQPLRAPATCYAYTMALVRQHRLTEAREFAGRQAERFSQLLPHLAMPFRMTAKAFILFARRLERTDINDALLCEYFEFLSYGKF